MFFRAVCLIEKKSQRVISNLPWHFFQYIAFVYRFQDFERRLVALEVSRETKLAPSYTQVIQEKPSTDAQSIHRIDKL